MDKPLGFVDKSPFQKHYIETPPRPAYGKIFGFGTSSFMQIISHSGWEMLSKPPPTTPAGSALTTSCIEGFRLAKGKSLLTLSETLKA